MLPYILLLALCGILCIITLILFIVGLVKKRQKLWIIGLSGFVIFFLGSIAAGFTYGKKQIEYMASEEFQEETRKTAENWGKNLGNTASGAADGLASSLDEEAIGRLAEKSGRVLGVGVKTISKGMDETAGKTILFPDEKLKKEGIRIGRAEEKHNRDSGYQFGIFLEFEKDYKGTLKLTAYDSEGLKMDISKLELDKKADDAGVEFFTFDNFKPGLSGYCILSE